MPASTPAQIVAAGCAGHGNGLYLLDRDDRPLIGIQSLDTRAAALAEELAAEHGDALPRSLPTGAVAVADTGAPVRGCAATVRRRWIRPARC